MFPEKYVRKGYAGLLGKVIGVRLGSPIEGWSYQRIAQEYGEVDGYLTDYINYASDDDLNGPLFFVRALLDYGLNASAEQMGKTLLNYVPHEHSFFWWGGYGVSTEHTAYTNLRAGIPAPHSGSIEQNGPVVAEQIGGQIFSDCWGFVCPGDPAKAAEYARRAASATHDGEGVFGGMFVAACVAAAYDADSVGQIIETGLAQIPADCLYAKVVRDIMAYHRTHPGNWRDCFRYIEEHWGYSRFPGNVHIIPNAAVMILALCYGGGEYGKTLCICNMCGWDTDCNVGNLGSIMGAFVGLEGIEDKWLVPLCDFLAASSVVGSLNIVDIAEASMMFTHLACDIMGKALPEPYASCADRDAPACHFELPGSLHAFRFDGVDGGALSNTDACAYTGARSLRLTGDAADGARLYRRTYYVPDDFSDSRYDPSFSPTFYPGGICTVFARSASGPVRVRMAAWGREDALLCTGNAVALDGDWQELTLDTSSVPTHATIFGVGLAIDGGQKGLELYVDDWRASLHANYTIDFSKEQIENWDQRHKEISQVSRLGGLWELLDGALWGSGTDYCRAYTGHTGWTDYTVSARIAPQVGEAFRLLGRAQGAERCYAAALRDGALWIEKQDGAFLPLTSAPLAYALGEPIDLTLTMQGGRITAAVGDVKVAAIDESPYHNGCIGWAVEKGRMKIASTSVSPVTLE